MTETVVYSSPGGWLEVFETSNKFYYARRKGRDSIAIFLIKGDQVLVRYQPLPRDNNEEQVLYPCPVTGSIDEGEEPIKCATREVLEETGYIVNPIFLFDYLVGTQSDELVYVYYADITDDSNKVDDGVGDSSYFESISKNVWEHVSNLKDYNYVACRLFYTMCLAKGII